MLDEVGFDKIASRNAQNPAKSDKPGAPLKTIGTQGLQRGFSTPPFAAPFLIYNTVYCCNTYALDALQGRQVEHERAARWEGFEQRGWSVYPSLLSQRSLSSADTTLAASKRVAKVDVPTPSTVQADDAMKKLNLRELMTAAVRLLPHAQTSRN